MTIPSPLGAIRWLRDNVDLLVLSGAGLLACFVFYVLPLWIVAHFVIKFW